MFGTLLHVKNSFPRHPLYCTSLTVCIPSLDALSLCVQYTAICASLCRQRGISDVAEIKRLPALLRECLCEFLHSEIGRDLWTDCIPLRCGDEGFSTEKLKRMTYNDYITHHRLHNTFGGSTQIALIANLFGFVALVVYDLFRLFNIDIYSNFKFTVRP